MWFIEFGLRTYFILKCNRFLTTVIFTGSASTVHTFIENSASKFHFIQAMIHAYQW